MNGEITIIANKQKKVIFYVFITFFITFTLIYKFKPDTSISRNIEQTYESQVLTKHNAKEIVAYSDTTCSFNLVVSVLDRNTIFEKNYGDLQINKYETLTLTLDDLDPGFFSDKAIIKNVYTDGGTYISNFGDTYEEKFYSLIINYSKSEIIVRSDNNCYFDLTVSVKNKDYNYSENFKKIKVDKEKTLVLTLNDLAPNFFPNDTTIEYVEKRTNTYEKE